MNGEPPDLTFFKTAHQPAAAFAERAFHALDSIEDDDARIRRVGTVKNVVEEILPLALFARYFDVPERRVACRYLGDIPTEPDGEIVLSGRAVDRGFYPAKIAVEITCAEDTKAYLRREALATHGAVFAGQNIVRTATKRDPKSVIVSRPEVRDGDAAPRDLALLIRAAIEKKAAKRYSPARLSIVRIEPDYPVSSSEMCDVATLSRPKSKDGLAAAYLVECSTGAIVHIF